MTTWLLAGLGIKLLVIGQAIHSGPFPPSRAPLLTTLGLLALSTAWLIFLRPRARAWCALGFNALVTTVALSDLWYFRFSRDVLSVVDLNGWWQLQPAMASLPAVIRPVDFIAGLDIALIAGALIFWRRPPSSTATWRVSRVLAIVSLGAMALVPILQIARHDPDEVFEYAFQRTQVVGAAGLAGYHVYDVIQNILRPLPRRLTVSDEDARRVADLIRTRNAQRFASRLSGLARGRNVIVVSAESLQAFVLGLSIGGVPVAPNLTAFARESLHFTRFYDQTHRSTTSDAEFISLNSLMPLPFGAVATRHTSNDFQTVPRVLKERGYRTISACAEPSSFWNMGRMHPQLGFERSLFAPDFRATRWVGSGLDDVSFFDEMAGVLESERAPFFAYLISSSNHHPFDLPADLRRLTAAALPTGMAGDYLQSVRYFDDAFGQFMARLARDGILEQTMVVVFGDHEGWFEEADLRRLWRAAGHQQDPSPLESWRFRRQVPLLIRLPGRAAAGDRDTPGGQLDIAPTLLSLLGIDAASGPWLGRDLTAPARNLVVFRDGSVTDDAATVISGSATSTTCYAKPDAVIPCEWLHPLVSEGKALLAASDTLVEGNVARAIMGQLAAMPGPSPRAPRRVLVIAHRGDSVHAPENTLAAIRAAFDAGADVVEVDVRLTRDGVPMIFHDDTMERTSNGTGPFERLSLQEVKALDAGSWFDKRFAGARIPTLEEALRVAHGRGSLLLDLKAEGLAAAVRAVYERVGVDPVNAFIGGWTPAQRADFARELPRARILKTEVAPLVWGPALYDQLRAQGIWGFELGDYWPAPFVADAALNGMPVIAYTVNDEATLTRLIEAGVAGIETDDPALLIRIAARLGAR